MAKDLPPHELKTTPSWGSRLVGVEGLRGVAALAVLVTHVGFEMNRETASGGAWGVVGFARHGLTLFFVLSGFLLFRPFVAAVLRRTPAPPAGRFLRNRLLRIFPAYVVILLLVTYVLQVAAPVPAGPSPDVDATGALSPLAYLIDALLLHTFVPEYFHSGITVAWSLSVEFTFYLLLPPLAFLAARLALRIKPVVAVMVPPVLLLILGAVGKAWFAMSGSGLDSAARANYAWGNTWTGVLAHSIFVHADLFAYGMAAAVVFVLAQADAGANWIRHARLASWVAVLPLLGLAWGRPTPGIGDSFAAMAATAVMLLVVLPARGRDSRFAAVMEVLPVRFTGLISYSVYLWHVPLIWLIQRHGWAFGDSVAGFFGNLIIVLLATLALATVTYRLVEAPALRLKKRTDASLRVGVGPAGLAEAR